MICNPSKLGIRDFEGKWGQDSGLNSMLARLDAKNNHRDYCLSAYRKMYRNGKWLLTPNSKLFVKDYI